MRRCVAAAAGVRRPGVAASCAARLRGRAAPLPGAARVPSAALTALVRAPPTAAAGPARYAVVGAGLAGLATAYHLLVRATGGAGLLRQRAGGV